MSASDPDSKIDLLDGPEIVKKKLKKGSYTVFAQAVDSAGQKQAGFSAANKRAFKVR